MSESHSPTDPWSQEELYGPAGASRAARGLVLLPWWWHLLVPGLGTCSSFEFYTHTPLTNSFWAGRSSLFGSPSSPVPPCRDGTMQVLTAISDTLLCLGNLFGGDLSLKCHLCDKGTCYVNNSPLICVFYLSCCEYIRHFPAFYLADPPHCVKICNWSA